MAIIDSQLVHQPQIEQKFLDPNTLGPVNGIVTFFKTDKTTLKNIYIETFDPENPFEVAENPQTLLVTGAFEQPIYYYFYDETDNTTEELYFIEVKDAASVVVLEVDNFVENFNSTVPEDDSGDLKNLCPSFGFDLPLLASFYNTSSPQFIQEDETQVALGWLWYKNAPTNSDFYYSYEEIDSGTLDGNPHFEITLIVANSGVAQSINWIGFPIANSNTLDGDTINFQFYATDKSTVPVTTLEVALAIDGDWTPTDLVSTALTSSRVLYQATATMPDLSSQFTVDTAKIYLCIKLPLAQDFEISFTGTFAYLGDQETSPSIPFYDYGKSVASQLLPQFDTGIEGNANEDIADGALALAQYNGTINTRNSTGTIFIAPISKTFNYALQLANLTLVRDQFIIAPNILTNRFLDDGGNLSGLAGNSFVITNTVTSAFDVATISGSVSYSTWASQTTDITIVKSTASTSYGISSVLNGTLQIDVTFDTNYVADTTAYNPSIPTGGGDLWEEGTTSTYKGPDAGAFISYIGTMAATDPGNEEWYMSFTNSSDITVTTTAPGTGGTPATVELLLTAGAFASAADIETVGATFRVGYDEQYSVIIYSNVLLYTDVAATELPAIPPFAIQFHVDSAGDIIPVSNSNITVNIPTSSLGDGELIAALINDAINVAESYTVTVVDVPDNGDILNISTTDTDLNVIFYDTAQAKPANPDPDRLPIYVEFTTSDSTDTISKTLSSVLISDVGGIPTTGDLLNVNLLPDLPGELAYFVEV